MNDLKRVFIVIGFVLGASCLISSLLLGYQAKLYPASAPIDIWQALIIYAAGVVLCTVVAIFSNKHTDLWEPKVEK